MISDDSRGAYADDRSDLEVEQELRADRRARRPSSDAKRDAHIASMRIEAQVAQVETAVAALKRRDTDLTAWPKLDMQQYKVLLAANHDLAVILENAGVRLLEESVEDLTGRHN